MKRILYFVLISVLGVSIASYASKHMESSYVSSNVIMLVSPNNHGSGGTGFVLQGPKGLITVTNEHICSLAVNSILDASSDDGETWVQLEIIRVSKYDDLCLVTPYPGKSGLVLADAEPSPDSDVYVTGHPRLNPKRREDGLYLGMRASTLIVPTTRSNCAQYPGSAWNTQYQVCLRRFNSYALDIEVRPGNSGSPLLNTDNSVIGVIFSANLKNGTAYAVPLPALLDFLNE